MSLNFTITLSKTSCIGLSVYQFLYQGKHFSLQLEVSVYHRNHRDHSKGILSSKSHNKTSAFDFRKKQAKPHCLESKLKTRKPHKGAKKREINTKTMRFFFFFKQISKVFPQLNEALVDKIVNSNSRNFIY